MTVRVCVCVWRTLAVTAMSMSMLVTGVHLEEYKSGALTEVNTIEELMNHFPGALDEPDTTHFARFLGDANQPNLHGYGASHVFTFSNSGMKKVFTAMKDKNKQAFADALGYDIDGLPNWSQMIVVWKKDTAHKSIPIDVFGLDEWLRDAYASGSQTPNGGTITDTYTPHVMRWQAESSTGKTMQDNYLSLVDDCAAFYIHCDGLSPVDDIKKTPEDCFDRIAARLDNKIVDWLTGAKQISNHEKCKPTGAAWELRLLMKRVYGFNELWTGTGMTANAAGVEGVNEFLHTDAAIESLDGAKFVVTDPPGNW